MGERTQEFDVVNDPNGEPGSRIYRREGEAFVTVTVDERGKKRVTFQSQKATTYRTTATGSYGTSISVRDAIENGFIPPSEGEGEAQ